MFTGIRFQLLPVSTLYSNMALSWLLLVSNLVIMRESMLLRSKDLIVAVSIALCISLSDPYPDMPHELVLVFLPVYLVLSLLTGFCILVENSWLSHNCNTFYHRPGNALVWDLCHSSVIFSCSAWLFSEWPHALLAIGVFALYHVKFPGLCIVNNIAFCNLWSSTLFAWV